jgi:hypothetical protein
VETLLDFSAAHLRGGVALSGVRILSPESALAMQQQQVGLGGSSTVQEGWGVAWALERWSGHRVIGHDGGTIGQKASLRLFPELGLVTVVLTNSDLGPALTRAWYDALGPELGVERPTPRVEPDATVADLAPMLGAYTSVGETWEVRTGPSGTVELSVTSHLEDLSPSVTSTVVPLGPGRFRVDLHGNDVEAALVEAEGRSFLYNGRLLPRLTDAK